MLGHHGVPHVPQKLPEASVCSLVLNCHEHNFKKQISGNSSDRLTALGFGKIHLYLRLFTLGLCPGFLVPADPWEVEGKDLVSVPYEVTGTLPFQHCMSLCTRGSWNPALPSFAMFLQAAQWVTSRPGVG